MVYDRNTVEKNLYKIIDRFSASISCDGFVFVVVVVVAILKSVGKNILFAVAIDALHNGHISHLKQNEKENLKL